MIDLENQLAQYADHLEEHHYTPSEAHPAGSPRRRRILTLAAATVVVAGLGALAISLSGRGSVSRIEANDIITTTTNDPSPTEPEGPEDMLKTFEVLGAKVNVVTALDELPEQASVVRLSTTISDSGDGPAVCMGPSPAIAGPRRCGGFIVDGLSMDGWTQTQGDSTWGPRIVEVTWPPVDNHVSLISDTELVIPSFEDYVPPASQVEMEEFFKTIPPECADITNPTSGPALANWGRTYPDRAGLVYVVDGGPFGVMGLVGDLELVRGEFNAIGTEPCLIKVDYSFDQLEKAHAQVGELLGEDSPVVIVATGVFNRVEVTVTVADIETVRKLVEVVDDPGTLLITSVADIVE